VDVSREVARSDCSQPRVDALHRPDHRPREDEPQEQRESDRSCRHSYEEIAGVFICARVLGDDGVRPRRHDVPELGNVMTARTNAVIAQNASAYENSRNLFIGVAAGAIALALLLGFVLSWSVIGPMQRIDSRLAAIASGDFSGHVD